MSAHGALRQVENMPMQTMRKAEKLKLSKTAADNVTVSSVALAGKTSDGGETIPRKLKVRDTNKQNKVTSQDQDVNEILVDKKFSEKKSDESKVQETELARKSPKTVESEAQTDVTVSEELPKLTAEDLISPEASGNYWRRLANRLMADVHRESERNFELSVRLARITEEIAKKEKDCAALQQQIESATDKECESELDESENSDDENNDNEYETNDSEYGTYDNEYEIYDNECGTNDIEYGTNDNEFRSYDSEYETYDNEYGTNDNEYKSYDSDCASET